jgi:hypothetical protein
MALYGSISLLPHPLPLLSGLLAQEGLARFATEPYNPDPAHYSNRFMHLTNYSINKNSGQFVPGSSSDDACVGHKWSLKALKRRSVWVGRDACDWVLCAASEQGTCEGPAVGSCVCVGTTCVLYERVCALCVSMCMCVSRGGGVHVYVRACYASLGACVCACCVGRRLAEEGVDVSALWRDVTDLVIKTLIAVDPQVNAAMDMFVPYPHNCYELFGFDVLIDATLNAHLLEVNFAPSLACESPLDLKIKAAMVRRGCHRCVRIAVCVCVFSSLCPRV